MEECSKSKGSSPICVVKVCGLNGVKPENQKDLRSVNKWLSSSIKFAMQKEKKNKMLDS